MEKTIKYFKKMISNNLNLKIYEKYKIKTMYQIRYIVFK